MKRLHPLSFLLLVAACGDAGDTGPVPIVWGSDACDHCRMIVSEPPFAAQARFPAGKVEKYDDIGCLAHRLAAGAVPTEAWVAEAGTGKWLDAHRAFYFKGKDLKTPMASGLAAFGSATERDAFGKGKEGSSGAWAELPGMAGAAKGR